MTHACNHAYILERNAGIPQFFSGKPFSFGGHPQSQAPLLPLHIQPSPQRWGSSTATAAPWPGEAIINPVASMIPRLNVGKECHVGNKLKADECRWQPECSKRPIFLQWQWNTMCFNIVVKPSLKLKKHWMTSTVGSHQGLSSYIKGFFDLKGSTNWMKLLQIHNLFLSSPCESQFHIQAFPLILIFKILCLQMSWKYQPKECICKVWNLPQKILPWHLCIKFDLPPQKKGGPIYIRIPGFIWTSLVSWFSILASFPPPRESTCAVCTKPGGGLGGRSPDKRFARFNLRWTQAN